MQLVKKLQFQIATGIVSITLLVLELSDALSLGKFINNFFPCVENPTTSASCYIETDILTSILLVGIIITLLLVSTIKIVRYVRKH